NLGKLCEHWLAQFMKDARDNKELWQNRIQDCLPQLAEQATAKCRSDPLLSARDLKPMLDDVVRFLQRLDDGLHLPDGPFQDEESLLWLHREILQIFKRTTGSQRGAFVDRGALKTVMQEYRNNSWLQNTYLDWVMIDAFAAAELTATMELRSTLRGGL